MVKLIGVNKIESIIIIEGSEITSKTTMGVLGVLFDSKLQWIQHVALAIKKANNALSAIKLVKKYFNKHVRDLDPRSASSVKDPLAQSI